MTRSLLAAVTAIAATAGLALAAAPAAAEVTWLCRPGLAENPCELPQDTTVREFGRPDRVETPATGRREIDCFYVYPTVSNQRTPNATKARDPEVVSIAKYQAARFAQTCRVFAPIYRQATLLAITASTASPPDRRIAYEDVREAWREYLARDNGGRGVVLIGHSQGTRQLRQLVRQEIDPDPALRRRMVGALLIGGNVTVAEGRTTGGDFASVPLCTRLAQLGCVVAFSTFADDPPPNARFGRSAPPTPGDPVPLPGGPGFAVACTDPRPLAGTPGPLRILTPSEPFAPGPLNAGIAITAGGPPPTAPTTWVTPADRLDGACRTINGANVLRLDPVGPSRRPNPFPDPTWGTHLVDMNLTLDPLVALVARQAARYVRPQVRLTRRCVGGGRLRVRLAGRDADLVRAVEFTFDRRRVARDRTAPFERTLSRRTLAATRARRLHAVADLAQGAPRRLVVARTLPRCGLR